MVAEPGGCSRPKDREAPPGIAGLVVARRAWIVPNNIVSVDAFHVTFSVIHQAPSLVMV